MKSLKVVEVGRMVSEETLRQATERLVTQFRPLRVILFGSQARGTADARSDVDLLVICPVPGEAGSRRELMVAMDRALRGVEMATDVIILTPEEFERDRQIPGTVARPAWREGRVLYDAEELNPYASTVRYPGEDLQVNEGEARRAVETAKRVRDVVKKALREEGLPIIPDPES